MSVVQDDQISNGTIALQNAQDVKKIMDRLNAMTNSTSHSAIETPMRQAFPAPKSNSNESFEHVGEPQEIASPSNESRYTQNATPADFAADCHLALGHLKVQLIERWRAVRQVQIG